MAPAPETISAQRRATYDFNVAQAALARRAQADGGRWTLTALLVVHSGAFVVGALVDEGAMAATRFAAVAGLTLTLLAGLAAWAHWTLRAVVHTHWADDRLLDPADMSEVTPPRLKRVADLAWLIAMLCATGAVIAAPVAMVRLGG
ncbi:hypothetical protein [Methylopila sp. M107]|uniref:hypothetical protein n=1 Tax=Methylopila sp. M107 TaxID=1101190 RepID=UPI0003814507|nr:hypothetical protein [Methylopila sp. M107]